MVFDRGGVRIRRWHRRRSISLKAIRWSGAATDSYAMRMTVILYLETQVHVVDREWDNDKLMGQIAKRVEDKRVKQFITDKLKLKVNESTLSITRCPARSLPT